MSDTLRTIIVAFLLCCIAGCDTMNTSTGPYGFFPWVPNVTSVLVEAQDWSDGEIATITVYWRGNHGPFEYFIDTGSPAGYLTGQIEKDRPIMRAIKLSEGSYYIGRVTITDGKGYTNHHYGDFEAEFTYGPVGPPLNDDPTIENVTSEYEVLTVTVADTEGDDVTVTVTDIPGLAVDSNSVVVPGGNGDAVFNWSAADIFSGGTGTTTITAADELTITGDEATETALIDIVRIALEPAEGQIVACAMSGTAGVGETVTVRVLCGDFPAGAAFNYMNGVGVTVTDGGDFVEDTFNVGSIGGDQKDVDGIWADMSPAPSTFFVPENFMMRAVDVVADSNLDFMGFNITPIGAGEVSGGGDLFNFGIAFDAAGTYELGFIEFQDVKRTYYSDNAAVEHNWTDTTNTLPGLINTITVT